MRFFFVIACFIFTASLLAQGQSAAQHNTAETQASQGNSAPVEQVKIDPAKEADIRRLLELTGAKGAMKQILDQMGTNLKPLLTNSLPPGDYRDKLVDLFFIKFIAKVDLQHLIDLAVPLYDKHFSREEIKGLLRFYETPLGQKASAVLPQLAIEMNVEGGKWGEALGRDVMQEVLAEHPDLAKALDAATKDRQP